MTKTVILLCKCRGEHFQNNNIQEIEDHLSQLSIDLFIVDDLCASVLTNANELNALTSSYE